MGGSTVRRQKPNGSTLAAWEPCRSFALAMMRFSCRSMRTLPNEPVGLYAYARDLHATILHLLEIDHKKLSSHYGDRDDTPTDVDGEVAHQVLA